MPHRADSDAFRRGAAPLPPPLTPYSELVINVCPTGPLLTPEHSPHVPLQPQQVVEDVCRCLERGASIVHLHARDRRGRPTYRAQVYEEMILGIRRHFPDALIGVSCIGNDFPELERRSEVLELDGAARPDLASLATTTFDFPRGANPNPPDVVIALAERMRARGIRPELECFDSGMASVARTLARRGVLVPPFYANVILGGRTTCPATARHLAAVVDDLPPGTTWAAGGAGLHQLPVNTLALAMGGHCRTGLEDGLHHDFERRMPATNPGLVARVVELAELFGRPVASRGRARELLGFTPVAAHPLQAAEGRVTGGEAAG